MPAQVHVPRLKAREFLFRAEDRAMASLADAAAPFERRLMWTILQLHYGDPWLHFELQPQLSRGIIEVGLHFEGPADQNEQAAVLVAARADAIEAGAGPGWEMEEWTPSWRRLHRVFTFASLTPALADEVGDTFAGLITAAHPVLVEARLAGVPRSAPPPGAERGRRPPRRGRRSRPTRG